METETLSDLELLKNLLPPIKSDLSEENQRIVEHIAEVSENDAAAAARLINQLEETDVFCVGVREVLNGYYSKIDGVRINGRYVIEDDEDSREKISIFSEIIDERAEEILQNYKDAQEEKEKYKNLDYFPGEITVMLQIGEREEKLQMIAEYMETQYWDALSGLTREEREKYLSICHLYGTVSLPLDMTVDKAIEILEQLPSVYVIVKSHIPDIHLDVEKSAETKTDKSSAPRKLTANYKKLVMKAGTDKKIRIKSVKPAGASGKVTWKSKNTKVASVTKNGKVRGKKAGTTQIIGTSTVNKKVKVKIKVVVRGKKGKI